MMNDPVHESLVRVARRTLVVVAIVALALLVWRIRVALLLAFIGILLAVFFRGLASLVSHYTRIPVRWAMPLVAAAGVGLVVLFVWLAGPPINEQFSELAKALPRSINEMEEIIQRYPVGRYILDSLQAAENGARVGMGLFSQITGVASALYGILANLLLIAVSALYFAVNPQVYRRGFLLLMPKSKADRMGEILDETTHLLQHWLLGQVIAMFFVGLMTALGLWLVGTPLALVLGVISGTLEFVPIFGPVAAAVPGILIGLTAGWTQGLYTAAVYLFVQAMEGYILVPLIQRVAVKVPPALIVLAIVAFGSLFGFLGVFVATPLIALVILWAQRLYVEDALGKSPAPTGI